MPVGLFEVDARTRYRGFTARAEIAFLFIGDTAALNPALRRRHDPNRWRPSPVASQLRGGYVEAGYDVLRLARAGTDAGRDALRPLRLRQHPGERPGRLHRQPRVHPLHVDRRPRLPADSARSRIKADYRRHEFGAGPSYNEFATALTWMF